MSTSRDLSKLAPTPTAAGLYVFSPGSQWLPLDIMGSNLLINGDFSLNQRNFAGGALAAGVYGYDRWGAYNGGANYSVSSDVVTLNSGVICQVIESPGLAGERVTLSMEAPSGSVTITIGNGTGSSSASGVIAAGSGRRGVTLIVPTAVTGDLKVRIGASSSVTFSRVQLEVGGNVTKYLRLNRIRDSLLVNRYYQRVYSGGSTVANGKATIFLLMAPLMRALPTVAWIPEFGTLIGGPYAGTRNIAIEGTANVNGQFTGTLTAEAEIACTD